MLKKVYVSENPIDALSEVRRDFGKVKVFDYKELDENSLVSAHSKGLFNSGYISCFVGLDKLNEDTLFSILENGNLTEFVWIFSKLDKRKKIYKRLKAASSVEEFAPLVTNKREKAKFVGELLAANNIPRKYSEYFTSIASDNKLVMRTEAQKLRVALEVLNEDELRRCLCVYESNRDLLEFIDQLFSGNFYSAYGLTRRLISIPIYVIRSTLSKRITSFIYLSMGNSEAAKKFWDVRGYYVAKDTGVAKKFGTEAFLNLKVHLEEQFMDYMSSDDLLLKLNKLVYQLEKTPTNESNSSW
jgi:DNA polymerase III delta subunit